MNYGSSSSVYASYFGFGGGCGCWNNFWSVIRLLQLRIGSRIIALKRKRIFRFGRGFKGVESERSLPVIGLGNDSFSLLGGSRLIKHLPDGGILLTAHAEGLRVDHHAVCVGLGIRVGVDRIHVRHVIIC